MDLQDTAISLNFLPKPVNSSQRQCEKLTVILNLKAQYIPNTNHCFPKQD